MGLSTRVPLEMASRQPPADEIRPQSPFASTSDTKPILVNLSSLSEGWPDALCQEIVQLDLVEARVAFPFEVIERALRKGRVAFSWKLLRSWINAAPRGAVSAHDSLALELPLKLIAPLFLARQKETTRLHKRVVVDDEIPNLFFGFPRPDSGGSSPSSGSSSAPLTPADSNFYTREENMDLARMRGRRGQHDLSHGTKFVAKYATPNEIVSRAAALDGVAGAFITLPDGLMVASRLPPDLNSDTLAAFLPQIFSKVSQCTKELRMGELNNVSFTVGNIPWKIFRVNAIFFAAFGRVGEPLLTVQLAALAAELDHKPE
ncbi:MAG: roadblock/LC7 domain-containing protein [Verrucomicrobia bacterium]|nr:roadblock/LC7 domain-containing protein [Verrucomicrobiota bacterium]